MGNAMVGSATRDRFGSPLVLAAEGFIVAVGARYNGNVGRKSGLIRIFNKKTPDANSTRARTAPDQFAYSGMAMSQNGHRLALATLFESLILIHPTNLTWQEIGPDVAGLAGFESRPCLRRDKILAGSAYGSCEYGKKSEHDRALRYVTRPGNPWEVPLMDAPPLRCFLFSSNDFRLAAGATQPTPDANLTSVAGYVLVWNSMARNGTRRARIFEAKTKTSWAETLPCPAIFRHVEPILPGTNSRLVQVDQLDNNTEEWVQCDQPLFGAAAEGYFGMALDLYADGSRLTVGASQGKVPQGYVNVFDYNDLVGQPLMGAQELMRFGSYIQLSKSGMVSAVGAINRWDQAGQLQVFNLTKL